jgi:hypothetical protein
VRRRDGWAAPRRYGEKKSAARYKVPSIESPVDFDGLMIFFLQTTYTNEADRFGNLGWLRTDRIGERTRVGTYWYDEYFVSFLGCSESGLVSGIEREEASDP